MSCPYTQEDLSAHVDGELDVATSARVREHLRVCPACEREVAWLSEVAQMVRALPQATPQQATAWKAESLADRAPRRLQCTVVLAEASALIDGELPEEHAADVQAHLFSCDACYHVYKQLEQVAEALQTTEPVPVPVGLEQRVWAAVQADQRAVVRGWLRRAFDCAVPGFRCSLRLAAAAVFLFAVSMGAWHYVAPRGVGGEVAPTSVAVVGPAAPTRPAPRPLLPTDRLRDNAALAPAAAAPRWSAADVFGTVEKVAGMVRDEGRHPGPAAMPPGVPPGPSPRGPAPSTSVVMAPTVRPPEPAAPATPPRVLPSPPPPAGSTLIVDRPASSGETVAEPPPTRMATSSPKTAPPDDRHPLAPPPPRLAELPSERRVSATGADLEVRVERSSVSRPGSTASYTTDRARPDSEASRIRSLLKAASRAEPARWKVPIR